MILLSQDCLVIQTKVGDTIPYSTQLLTLEILSKSDSPMDEEFLKHAGAAVLHYFRDELGRETVTVGEFTQALEKIVSGFVMAAKDIVPETKPPRIVNADLSALANEYGDAGELLFFPRLRDELKTQLSRKPELLYFRGLRACVKRLSGCSRWSNRCQSLQDQIVDFLRNCVSQDSPGSPCAVVVR